MPQRTVVAVGSARVQSCPGPCGPQWKRGIRQREWEHLLQALLSSPLHRLDGWRPATWEASPICFRSIGVWQHAMIFRYSCFSSNPEHHRSHAQRLVSKPQAKQCEEGWTLEHSPTNPNVSTNDHCHQQSGHETFPTTNSEQMCDRSLFQRTAVKATKGTCK